MSPIHCIRFILFRVSCDLSALLFLCERMQSLKGEQIMSQAMPVKGSELDAMNTFPPSSDVINPLALCNFWPLCHWFLSELYEPIHPVYNPYCLIGSLDCAEREMHLEAKIPPTHFYDDSMLAPSSSLSLNPVHHIYATQKVT